jgi:hypothetical protein
MKRHVPMQESIIQPSENGCRKARSFQAVKYIMETYPNASKFTRQYDIGDRGEWGYLETYLSHKQIDNEARRLHKALGL